MHNSGKLCRCRRDEHLLFGVVHPKKGITERQDHQASTEVPATFGAPFGARKSFAARIKRGSNLGLQFWSEGCHKAKMDKHSRAFGRHKKGKRKPLFMPKRKPRLEKEVVPDQLVELATDAIRDGQTTVAMFLAPFHPDLRFKAFRAYTAAISAFMAKWRR
jgi:hypothetical protein